MASRKSAKSKENVFLKGANLVFGHSRQVREQEITRIIRSISGLENYKEDIKINPDVLVVTTPKDKKSIGVEEIKDAINFLTEKPFSHKYKILVIEDAHNILDRAQNILLKTLEEPPTYATIILSAKSEGALLETITSRCRKISVEKMVDIDNEGVNSKKELSCTFETFVKSDMGKRFELVEKLAKEDRQEIISQLEGWIKESRGLKDYQHIPKLLEGIKILSETNANTRLVLETLAVQI